MILIDSLTVCGEKTDTKWESDYFQLVRRQFLTTQNEFIIYDRRRVLAENAKNPVLIGYSVYEIQRIWSIGQLVKDMKFSVYNHWNESFKWLEMKAYCY